MGWEKGLELKDKGGWSAQKRKVNQPESAHAGRYWNGRGETKRCCRQFYCGHGRGAGAGQHLAGLAFVVLGMAMLQAMGLQAGEGQQKDPDKG
jgi:hypothetical protein